MHTQRCMKPSLTPTNERHPNQTNRPRHNTAYLMPEDETVHAFMPSLAIGFGRRVSPDAHPTDPPPLVLGLGNARVRDQVHALVSFLCSTPQNAQALRRVRVSLTRERNIGNNNNNNNKFTPLARHRPGPRGKSFPALLNRLLQNCLVLLTPTPRQDSYVGRLYRTQPDGALKASGPQMQCNSAICHDPTKS